MQISSINQLHRNSDILQIQDANKAYVMIEERPSCPECGDPLSVFFLKDRKTGKITIEFFCEGVGDDKFTFHIITGITNGDIAKLKEEGKTIKREMGIKLVERRSEQEVVDSMDRDRQKS